MKSIAVLILSTSSFAWAQAQAPLTPETVIATVDGKPITAAEWMTFLQLKPRGADSKALLAEFGYMRKLAALAEKAHLDQQEPWKTTLQLQRTYVMGNAELQAAQDAI